MKRVYNNDPVQAEFPDKKLEHWKCEYPADPEDHEVCCPDGYAAYYDTSTQVIYLECL